MRALILACGVTLFAAGCQLAGNRYASGDASVPPGQAIAGTDPCRTVPSCPEPRERGSEGRAVPIPERQTPQRFPAAPVPLPNAVSRLHLGGAKPPGGATRVLSLQRTTFTLPVPRLITVPADAVKSPSSVASNSPTGQRAGKELTVQARAADEVPQRREPGSISGRRSAGVAAAAHDDLQQRRQSLEAELDDVLRELGRLSAADPTVRPAVSEKPFVVPSYREHTYSGQLQRTAAEAPSASADRFSNRAASPPTSSWPAQAGSNREIDADSGLEMWPFRPSAARPSSSPW